LGIILGAGIYAFIGEAANLVGNALWISFALAALVALITGMSYAELAALFPKASAEFEYTAQAFNKQAAFIVGWLIIFSGVVGAATVALGFAGYFPCSSQGSHFPFRSCFGLTLICYIVHRHRANSPYGNGFYTLIEALVVYLNQVYILIFNE
jgi:amino acid transporter